ncbi:hypothetical protein GJAV_G00215840 [Gymnothorax javanicus]|nr:hypothetical protein GJAV_G00215840 [Gymnothorax javanicus]
MKLSAKILEFEALILKKVAFLVQNPIRDISQSPGGNCEGVENCKCVDRSCMEIMYAEILARKLMAECEFWAEMEKLEAQTQVAGDGNSCGCIQTTLENSIQSLKALYDEKFQKLERELLEDQAMLNCQEFPLKEVVGTSEQLDSNRFGKGLNEDIHCSHGRMKDDTGPPDLCPYLEQIRMYKAGESSEEMVSNHLQEGSLTCSGRAVDYPPVCRDRLATELKIQAEVLQRLSHKIKLTLEMENVCFHPRLVNVLSSEHCSPAGDGAGGSLSMQKNIPDVACKLSGGQERDLELCKQAHKSIGSQCPEYCQSVGATPECCLTSLQECKSLKQAVSSLREENQTLSHEVSRLTAELSLQQEETEQLEERFRVEAEELQALCKLEISQAEQRSAANEMSLMEKMADCQQKLEVLLLDVDGMEDRHEEDVRALEAQFQERIDVLLSTHQKELERLQSQCTQTLHTLQGAPDRLQTRQSQDPMLLAPALPFSEQALPTERQAEDTGLLELDSVIVLRQRILELEDQVDELTNNKPEGDLSHLKEQYQKDLDDLKAACERGFATVEEAHCREIREIRRQHQREVSGLLQEQERLLAEETAATVAAVEALKSSHREELERLQRSELHRETPDIQELRELHRLEAADGELEVLSVLFSQKCLESSQLAQALESERRALSRCQRENQELDMRLQELNHHLTVELARMQSSHLLKQGNDLYDVEELVRRKDSEIRCLKQEVFSLRNELQSVLRDTSYASDNHRDSRTELSVVKAEAGCDISGLEEQLNPAAEALPTAAGDDILLKESSDLCGLMTGVRSESDVEQTWDG